MQTLEKGMRIRAEWLEAHPPGSASLAGVQLKVTATQRVVEGIVMRIRGDHPVSPTSVGVWVETDDGDEVIVDARHIVCAAPAEPS